MSSLRVVLCLLLVLGTLVPSRVYAVGPAAALTVSAQELLEFKGVSIDIHDPFAFNMILEPSGHGTPADQMVKSEVAKESLKLAKYFLASLAIPSQEMWVNLSPYEKDRIIPPVLGQTVLGLDMLGQDYILKQISANLLNPDTPTGRAFWKKARARARAMYGRDDVPIDTFNKVWIVPDKAVVDEHRVLIPARVGTATIEAIIVARHLKVMLEEDYLTASKDNHRQSKGRPEDWQKEIMREVIVPVLEHEVNTGKDFAVLRQIYDAMILSTWYKRQLKATLLAQSFMNKNQVKGLEYSLHSPQEIYSNYLKSFKKGAFNFVKEELDSNGASIPRKYFSGGLEPVTDEGLVVIHNGLTHQSRLSDMAMRVQVAKKDGIAHPKSVEREVPQIGEIIRKRGLSNFHVQTSEFLRDERLVDNQFRKALGIISGVPFYNMGQKVLATGMVEYSFTLSQTKNRTYFLGLVELAIRKEIKLPNYAVYEIGIELGNNEIDAKERYNKFFQNTKLWRADFDNLIKEKELKYMDSDEVKKNMDTDALIEVMVKIGTFIKSTAPGEAAMPMAEISPEAKAQSPSSVAPEPDSAMTKGGIDLNEDKLDLKVQGQAVSNGDRSMTVFQGPMDGFVPVIVKIEPYNNSLTPSSLFQSIDEPE